MNEFVLKVIKTNSEKVLEVRIDLKIQLVNDSN